MDLFKSRARRLNERVQGMAANAAMEDIKAEGMKDGARNSLHGDSITEVKARIALDFSNRLDNAPADALNVPPRPAPPRISA